MSGTTKAFNDLIEGTEYEFRVLAENEAGISKPSESTGIFKAKDLFTKPGKPRQPEVTELTPDSATLTWGAPESDGGAKISNYIVEMHEVGEIKWKTLARDVKDTNYKVTGLKEGSAYEFRVTAENKAGVGTSSQVSQAAKYGEHDRPHFHL